eukprot:TRINITY_DN3247_c1_g3_i2.p1 TRINITY_DN3247_c1_g3~~TRINITY_DN3247_c1_g3_i2.p1  ORF type:complete len:304 (+),score=54.57 TRINITY_DN3247_c1_g3_i2:48-914(+)
MEGDVLSLVDLLGGVPGSAGEALRKAINEQGYAILGVAEGEARGLPPECRGLWDALRRVDTTARHFFTLPEPEKTKHTVPEGTTTAYPRDVGYCTEFEDCEFFQVRAHSPLSSTGEPTEVAQRFYEALQGYLWIIERVGVLLCCVLEDTPEVGRGVLSGLFDGCPLPPSVSSSSILRALHYFPASPAPTPPDSPRIAFGSHTDGGLVTISPLLTTPGLQILNQRSGAWEDIWLASPLPDLRLVVYVGETIQSASWYYYRAAYHRVLKGPWHRYSYTSLLRNTHRKSSY